MRVWLHQHTRALQLVLGRMRRQLLSTIIMCLVMGVTLCLPGTLYVVVDNLNRLAGSMPGNPQISLFLQLDATSDTLEALTEKLRAHPAIDSFQFVSKEQAWQQLQQSNAAAAASLQHNPLPDAYFITPGQAPPESLEALQSELAQWEGVETAQLDASWIKRLHALLQIARKAILLLTLLLGFALVAIIGNTIRLQILTQREEIEVSKLIGATDRFIRRPFLYAGAVYGLGSGLVAWLLLAGIISLFNVSVTKLAKLYASDFTLHLPSLTVSISIIASAAILSWIGSYIAVNRSLSKLTDQQASAR